MTMTNEPAPALQNTFLRYLQDRSVPVTMFLVNGIRLQGHVSHSDAYCVLLTRDARSQLIYKHAISTIDPVPPIRMYDAAEHADEGSASSGQEQDAPGHSPA